MAAEEVRPPDEVLPPDEQAAAPAGKKSALSRGYEAVVRPLTKAVSAVANDVTEPLVSAARYANGESAAQATDNLGMDPNAVKDRATRNAAVGENPLSHVIVPQTPVDAAIQGASFLVPGGTAARTGMQLLRSIGIKTGVGAAAGAAAGAMSDEGALQGGLKGATAGAVQGTLGAAERTARLARGRELLQPEDVSRVTGVAGQVAPGPMRGVQQGTPADTVNRFKELLGQEGERRASGAYRARMDLAIARATRPTTTTSSAPQYTPGVGGAPGTVANVTTSSTVNAPMVNVPTYNQVHGLPAGQPVSARDVLEFITDRHIQNRLKTPTGNQRGSVDAMDLRDIVNTMRHEFGAGLAAVDPQAGQLAQAANSEFAAFKALQTLFAAKGLFKGGELDMVKLGETLQNPASKLALNLQRKLGPAYQDFIQAVFRGGPMVPDEAGKMGRATLWDALTAAGGLTGAHYGFGGPTAAIVGPGVAVADIAARSKLPRFTGTDATLAPLANSRTGRATEKATVPALRSIQDMLGY